MSASSGPFGQAGIFRNQPFILHQQQPRIRRCLGCAFTDDVAPLILINNHMRCTEFHRIVSSIANGDQAAVMETVPGGSGASGHTLNRARHHRVTKQRDNPL